MTHDTAFTFYREIVINELPQLLKADTRSPPEANVWWDWWALVAEEDLKPPYVAGPQDHRFKTSG